MASRNVCCHSGDGVKALNRLPQLAKPRLALQYLQGIRVKKLMRGGGREGV